MKIYHNEKCSKSRATLSLLKEAGHDCQIVEYLETPPTLSELDQICTYLDKSPLQLIRTNEAKFKELGLTVQDDRPREEWLKLMVENPILIERPIVVHQGKAAIGRPPESVLEILT